MLRNAMERGGMGAGPLEFKKALALRSQIRRAGWFS
jgi:hypothetical protein